MVVFKSLLACSLLLIKKFVQSNSLSLVLIDVQNGLYMAKNFVKYLAIIAFSFLSTSLMAQDDKEEEAPRDRWFFGGNFGLTFGDYTLINVSPQLGYRFTNRVAAGGGVNFQYISVKERFSNGDRYSKISQGVTGLNLFGRVYPIQNIMLQVQPEANYVFGKEVLYYTDPRQKNKLPGKLVPSLLAGGGLVFPSGRGALIMSVFYDVLQDPNSPYSNKPIVNFGYNMGF